VINLKEIETISLQEENRQLREEIERLRNKGCDD